MSWLYLPGYRTVCHVERDAYAAADDEQKNVRRSGVVARLDEMVGKARGK